MGFERGKNERKKLLVFLLLWSKLLQYVYVHMYENWESGKNVFFIPSRAGWMMDST
jgi:hypothetical protein